MFLPSADFFSSSTFTKNSFRKTCTISVPNSCDPDQADVMSGLIWFQAVCKRFSADDTSRLGKELEHIQFLDSNNAMLVRFELSSNKGSDDLIMA